MKASPAIALLVVGTAACGGLLELFTPASERPTMAFDEALAALGGWLLHRLTTVAWMLKKR